ncbi:hypothetical protein ACQPZP_28540 [Spirillospora sp. CA-142024]|uniref:hypothetical protein n=1 Tax=Spirillospora sp. CA-142024 TaxID=3240036 RepID=UPI003D8A1D1A
MAGGLECQVTFCRPHVIAGTDDVHIVETVFDLSAPPDALHAQIIELARRVATGLPT